MPGRLRWRAWPIRTTGPSDMTSMIANPFYVSTIDAGLTLLPEVSDGDRPGTR